MNFHKLMKTNNQKRSEFIYTQNMNLLANVVTEPEGVTLKITCCSKSEASKVEMNSIEKEVYTKATDAIINHASKNDLPVGFLTVTPQRMLTSCMPATVQH